jgi:hypothetical protein
MNKSTELLIRGINALDSAKDAADYDLSASAMFDDMARHFFERYAEELILEQEISPNE